MNHRKRQELSKSRCIGTTNFSTKSGEKRVDKESSRLWVRLGFKEGNKIRLVKSTESRKRTDSNLFSLDLSIVPNLLPTFL